MSKLNLGYLGNSVKVQKILGSLFLNEQYADHSLVKILCLLNQPLVPYDDIAIVTARDYKWQPAAKIAAAVVIRAGDEEKHKWLDSVTQCFSNDDKNIEKKASGMSGLLLGVLEADNFTANSPEYKIAFRNLIIAAVNDNFNRVGCTNIDTLLGNSLVKLWGERVADYTSTDDNRQFQSRLSKAIKQCFAFGKSRLSDVEVIFESYLSTHQESSKWHNPLADTILTQIAYTVFGGYGYYQKTQAILKHIKSTAK